MQFSPCLCDKSPETKFSVPWLQISESPCSFLFRKIFLTQQDLFSLFSRSFSCRPRLLQRSKSIKSRRRIYSSTAILEPFLVPSSSEFFSGANCASVASFFSGANGACVCHFSYAYATCVNFVMLMLMSQCKPGLKIHLPKASQ